MDTAQGSPAAGETYVCLQPEYVGRFRCDGQACGAKCCQGWKISVDGNTYQKYCQVKDKKLRKKIKANIIFSPQDNRFFFKLLPSGRCPFLQADNFCELQRNFGETALSNTCALYPREMYDLGHMLERSLSVSCPVAARLILLEREPLAFEQIELSLAKGRGVSINRLPKRLIEPAELPAHIFDVQYGAISILQNRRLSLDGRLIALGFFLEQADKLLSAGNIAAWPDLAAIYTADDFWAAKAPALMKGLHFAADDYALTIFTLLNTLYGVGSGDARRFLTYVNEAFGLAEGGQEVRLKALAARCEELFRSIGRDFLSERGYILENYLVNEFFCEFYPFRWPGSLTHNYYIFVLAYKLLELVAFCLASSSQAAADEDILVGFFAEFSALLDHNDNYMRQIEGEANKAGQDLAAFLGKLLRPMPI